MPSFITILLIDKDKYYSLFINIFGKIEYNIL